ncbi:MAG: hypothetical protein ACXABG_12665, partial [Promethearchaeota archaeon]
MIKSNKQRSMNDRKKNVRAYLTGQVAWLAAIIPAVVQLWQENGLSFAQILFLQGLFGLSMLILEFPSGVFADLKDRKTVLTIGHLFIALGSITYSVSHNFTQFLLAEVIYAIGLSSISGADTATIWDTCILDN